MAKIGFIGLLVETDPGGPLSVRWTKAHAVVPRPSSTSVPRATNLRYKLLRAVGRPVVLSRCAQDGQDREGGDERRRDDLDDLASANV